MKKNSSRNKKIINVASDLQNTANIEISNAFPLSLGTRQGCLLLTTSIHFMLTVITNTF